MIKLSEIIVGFANLNEAELNELFGKLKMFPIKIDIHKYSIMEDFIKTISDNLLHNQLLIAINGIGAFRRFKDICINFGCIDDWYKFRSKKYKEIAVKWYMKNNLKCEGDVIC
jgi:hypothetical protein